ncbi:MAG: adenylate/guanylate cyclase domain-containing protein, partial [Deltaproteobacteria bacterium]|nr:adenylate/guanylate cyclase domain-containing protein [Deltaproteobacteria bacterium]
MGTTSQYRGAAVVLVCALAGLAANSFGVFDSLEFKSIDLRFKTRNAVMRGPQKSDKVVLIEIDDESARRLPAPFLLWDPYFTKVVSSLNDSTAKVIAIDVLWLKSIEDFVELKTPSLRRPFIRELMRAATAKRLVLATPQTTKDVSLGRHAVMVGAENFAAVNPLLDSDNSIRRQSLAYEAVDSSGKITELPTLPDLVATRYSNEVQAAMPDPFLINFTSLASSFEHHTFYEVQERAAAGDHSFFEKTFGGKIALIGTTSSLLDRHKTPLGAETPGVYVHAFAIESLLSNHPFVTTGRISEALEIVFLCLLLGIPALYLSASFAGAGAAASGVVYTGLVYSAFTEGLVLPWVGPLLSGGFTLAVVLAYRFTVTDREKRRLTSIFKHYVNSKIVDLLVTQPEAAGVTGRRRQVCVVFSDIRGFTQLSETLSPEQIVNFLNTYLSAMSEIILAHDGTVDKFIGDGIMAYFGAPLANPNGARDAVRAALAMQIRLRELNAQWQAEGKSPLKIGIGIHYGDAIIGNIGSSLKMDYTAIGDAVNLASRV